VINMDISSNMKNNHLIKSLTLDLVVIFSIFFLIYLGGKSLLHACAALELFCIIASLGITFTSIETHGIIENDYFLIMGVAYTFIAAFTILHSHFIFTNANISKNVFNQSFQITLITILMESASILAFTVFLNKKNKHIFFVTILYLIISILILASIFYYKNFPACYTANHDFTNFFISGIIISCFMYLLSIYFLQKSNCCFNNIVYKVVMFSIIFKIFSCLSFFLKPVIDIYAYAISSAFNVTSYCLFYRAAADTSLKEPYNLLLYELKDSNNNLGKTIKNLQDEIATHTRTEDNLEKAVEKEKIKNDLFVNISHELRTPINIINSALQLVELYEKNQNDAEAYKKFKEYLKPMEQNCNRLSKLISNLIDMTKYDSCKLKLNMENCNIVDVVENITLSVVTYANLKDIEIIFDTDIEEKILACDTYMMERVVLNLLSNAIKFTPKGGKILVNIFDKGNTVLIKVADNGIGISEDKISTIFERFSQSGNNKAIESEGSGIGLSLVKAIVEMHHGTISVKSSKNEGTEFSIELPVKIIGDGKVECHEFNLIRNMDRIGIEMSDIE